MAGHSAILISKILKASHRHFRFDWWYGPVLPIVMSQQWPAPGDPQRRNDGCASIRRSVFRFERCCKICRVFMHHSDQQGWSSPHVVSCWYCFRRRGNQEFELMSLSSLQFQLFYICINNITFWSNFTLSCIDIHIFCFSPAFNLFVYSCFSACSISPSLFVSLHWVREMTLSWLGKIDRCSDGRWGWGIKIKMKARIRVGGHLTSCMAFFLILVGCGLLLTPLDSCKYPVSQFLLKYIVRS